MDQLIALMESKNISINELAKITNIHSTTIRRYLKGTVSPTLAALQKIAKGLEINKWEELLGFPNS